MYDLIIQNGNILNGTGSPRLCADIGIRDGKIVRIARGLTGAARIIDAAGLTVTPGFIDSHSHSDANLLTHPDQIEKIEQGITTAIGGQCGGTDAPIDRDITEKNARMIGTYGRDIDIFRTMGTFLTLARDIPQGSNQALHVGHRALRRAVMGTENRAPTPDELARMKALLRDAIEHGAIGLSFGLIYVPSCYAQTAELIELAKVAGEMHGIVSAHIRNEGDGLIEAVAEFIEVIRQSGARGVISHHKATHCRNWGKVVQTLQMIDDANAEGLEIYCDVYPYCASSTSLWTRFIPQDMMADGLEMLMKRLSDPAARADMRRRALPEMGDDLDWILITACRNHREVEGMRISEIARQWGKDPFETGLDLLLESKNNCTACFFTMCEEDVRTVLAHPRAMIATDSGVARGSKCYHPRLRGTFPRILGRYVREYHVTSLPEMIRKMTSMPAAVYGLNSKGILAEGFDADICIFDADRILDRADFTNCTLPAEGLCYVILNGQVVVEDAVYRGIRAGKVLLRQTDGL